MHQTTNVISNDYNIVHQLHSCTSSTNSKRSIMFKIHSIADVNVLGIKDDYNRQAKGL